MHWGKSMHSLHALFAQTIVPTNSLPNVTADHAELARIVDIIFTVTGGIALLVITVAGFRYIISRGEPQAISQAKDAIMYAAVGLVISIAAIAIVNFIANST